MSGWISQADAVKLLGELGDKVSQQALSQYLDNHPEVPRKAGGPGRPTLIDFATLRRSRETRQARGPAEKPRVSELLEPPTQGEPAAEAVASTAPGVVVEIDAFARRKAKADVDRAEADARRARVLADEAEGRVINREVAVNAFMTVGASIVQAFEQHRREALEEMLTAKDEREAILAIKGYERRVRAALATSLTGIADRAEAEASVRLDAGAEQ